jgi:hypothetical protein
MPTSKKKIDTSKTPAAERRKQAEPTFSSVRDFEEKMFPRAVASRSLQADGASSRTLGEQLGDALARELAGRLERRSS